MDEHDLVISPLSREIEIDGHLVKVAIYGSGQDDWILEVVDAGGNSTVWNDTFATDALALEEFRRAVEEDGIESMVGPVE